MDVALLVLDASKFSTLFEPVQLSPFLALVVVLLYRGVAGLFVLHLGVELLQLLSQICDFFFQLFRRFLEILPFNFLDFLDQNAPLELGVVQILKVNLAPPRETYFSAFCLFARQPSAVAVRCRI